MYRFSLALLAAGCSEYGLGGGLFGGRDQDPLVDENPEGGQDDGNPGEELFPGEDRPDDWDDWDASCGRLGSLGPGGGAGVDTYVIDESVEALAVMLTVGDVEIIPRAGPIEVRLSGVTLNGAQGAKMEGSTLVLDYTHSVGDLTVWAPPDLASYDLRMCVGNLRFSELSGELSAEVRTGNIDGWALEAPVGFVHNRTGNATLEYETVPEQLWMEGKSGNSVAVVPSGTCDCELDVGVGNARLVGIENDPSSPMSILSERGVGEVMVQRAE